MTKGKTHGTRAVPAAPGRTRVRIPEPAEHIILVGGPSNMVNGFGYVSDKGEAVGQKAPVDLNDVTRYISKPDGKTHPKLPSVGTHDRYWGNFVTPVPRLFRLGLAKPPPGSLVTIMVFRPPFVLRGERDWALSPFNYPTWRYSPWVRGRFPYDPTAPDPRTAAPPPKHPSLPPLPPLPFPVPTPPPSGPVSEARLDHEIYMRAIDESDADRARGVVKFPRSPTQYLELIHDLPREVLFGPGMKDPPQHPGVLFKLLMSDDGEDFFTTAR